jgi:hypothetical protein
MRLNYQNKYLNEGSILNFEGKQYLVISDYKELHIIDDEKYYHKGWGLECLDETYEDRETNQMKFKRYDISLIKDKPYELNH